MSVGPDEDPLVLVSTMAALVLNVVLIVTYEVGRLGRFYQNECKVALVSITD